MNALCKDQYSTWIEVDLSAVENNVQWMKQRTGVQVMAVVKANAYGHGAVPVAQAAVRAGATWCGVARLEEGLELRRAGLDCPILLLGYTPLGRTDDAIAARLSMTVWDVTQLAAISSAAERVGKPAQVHLKVDSGMSRIGVQPKDAVEMARQIVKAGGVVFEGMFTHFARADEANQQPTDEQEKKFQQVVQALQAIGLRPPWVHAANTAAALTRPNAAFDLVRTGIALYGINPSSECPLPSGFRQALTWKTVLTHVKVLPAGRGVSYGHQYLTSQTERIGTLAIGYADGLRRMRKNEVLAGGKRVPVVGRVCMDQAMVRLDDRSEAKIGDEVVLIGSQGDETISVDEVAERWETSNYDVVSGIAARVARVYFASG